jgi:hypothetical protein
MSMSTVAVRITLEGGKQVEGQLEIIGNKGQAALMGIDRSAGRVGVSTGAARQQMIGLGYQLNDLFVQLQSGANPMTALVQQGSQVVGMYAGQGGVKQAFSQFGQLVTGIFTKFPLLTAGVLGTTAVLAGMTHEINQATGASVSMGDTALAVMQTFADYMWSEIQPLWGEFAGWADTAWDGVVSGAKWAGNLFINMWRVAFKSVQVLFGTLPDIVGAAAVEAVNSVIRSIDQMIALAWNGIQGLVNAASFVLSSIPGNEGFTFGQLPAPPVIGAVDNPYAANVGAAGSALWGSVQDIMGEDVMGAFFGDVASRAAANAAARGKDGAGGSAGRGGGGDKPEKEADPTGLAAMMASLEEYATKAQDIGKDIGDALVDAFDAGADAIANFVKTGKFEVGDLVNDMIAQFARLAAQHFITGPLAGLLGDALGGLSGGFGEALSGALTSFDGGGYTGNGPRSGGLDGRGGFLAILHPQEQVVDGLGGLRAMQRAQERLPDGREALRSTGRGESQGGNRGQPTPVVMNVYARDAQSFRQSRGQIAADAARFMQLAGRMR